MKGKVKCTCGWSWNKSDSSAKDMYICHECGRDNSNNMKNGGWMDNYNDSKASAPEGMVGDGFSNVGRNYSPAWGGQFEEGGEIPKAQGGKATRADSLVIFNNAKNLEDYFTKQKYKKTNLKINPNLQNSINETKKWEKEARNAKVDTFGGIITLAEAKKAKQKQINEASGWVKEITNKLNKEKKEIKDKNDVSKYLSNLEKSRKEFDERLPGWSRYTDEQGIKRDESKILPEQYYKPLNENQFYQREASSGNIDLRSPMALYDTRITPQSFSVFDSPDLVTSDALEYQIANTSDYKKRDKLNKQLNDFRDNPNTNTDRVEMYQYDPLAVMPFDILKEHPELIPERIKKYGTEGIPTSVIQQHPEWVQTPMTDPAQRQPVQSLRSLTPLQPVGTQIEASLPVIRPDAKIPKSYNVSALRYNMKGPSDYYNYNQEGVDYETAMKAKAASDAYNAEIEKKYGPESWYYTRKSPKLEAIAAERLKQLRSEFNMTPNYQMGGNVYPVNYVPKAQFGLGLGLAGAMANKIGSWFSDDEPVEKPVEKAVKKPAAKSKIKVDFSKGPLGEIEKKIKEAMLLKEAKEKQKTPVIREQNITEKDVTKVNKKIPTKIEEKKKLVPNKNVSELKIPEQVTRQIDYAKYWDKPGQNFAVVDKDSNVMYYVNPQGQIVDYENVITGATNKDEENAPSMKEYGKTANEYYDYLKNTNQKVTPAGVFTLRSNRNNSVGKPHSLWDRIIGELPFVDDVRLNTLDDPSLLHAIYNEMPWREEEKKEYYDHRVDAYGPTGNLFRMISQYGVPSSKGLHGTGNANRIGALYDADANRDLSNGCINVGGQTKCFDILGDKSKLYVLPETEGAFGFKNITPSKNQLYSKFGHYADSDKKNWVEQEDLKLSREDIKNAKATRNKVANIIKKNKIKATQEEIDFVAAVAQKETKGGESWLSSLESTLPGFSSYGLYEQKESFPYLKGKSPNDEVASTQAVIDFYRDMYKKHPELRYSFYPDEAIYSTYNSGRTDWRNSGIYYGPEFRKALQAVRGYENGGSIPQAEEGIKMPSRKDYKTQGQYNAALRQYKLNLRKYELNNNPEKLKGESDKDYKNRTKYFKHKVRQEENKHPLSKAYLEMKDDQNADPNPVTKTLRQIFTSPVHVAHGIYNAANPHDLDRYKSRATKNNEDIDLGSSSLDAASLGIPFDYGMKAIPLWLQALKRTGKEVIEDKGFDLIKQANEYINSFQTGGSLPGAPGHMYDRVGAPSKGPRRNQVDVTDASAQNGKEMRYYQEGLDWKPKTISRNGGWLDSYEDGGIIKDDRGQWAYPGEITEIGSNQITMQGVPYPVLGISNTGDIQMMYPGEDYEYDGESVTEFPMAKNGLRQEQKGLVNLDQLTNFTNYNKPQPGGWLNKYN